MALGDYQAFPPGLRGGFVDKSGSEVKCGDRVYDVKDGQTGELLEAFHDGDALVAWDYGLEGWCKWGILMKIAPPRDQTGR